MRRHPSRCSRQNRAHSIVSAATLSRLLHRTFSPAKSRNKSLTPFCAVCVNRSRRQSHQIIPTPLQRVNRAGLAQRGSGKIEDLTMSSHFLSDPDQARVANGSWSKENDIGEAVRRAFGRVSSWRTPPHWSRCDWLDEVRAILHSGAMCARLNYDRERGVPLRAHIYMRSIAAVWSRYRQEWSYYLHTVPESGARTEPIATPLAKANGEEALDHVLGQALKQLSAEDQLLIHRLFWDDAAQRRIAATLQISQQSVSKRKARVLRLLHGALISQFHLVSDFLTVCWAFLDSLDLLPIVDLL